MDYQVNDVVIMKKAHPCGENKWKILRTGMDYKLKCMNCGRIVMMPHQKFIKGVKRRIDCDE